eukprot:4172863-Amphidinium_carterae.2
MKTVLGLDVLLTGFVMVGQQAALVPSDAALGRGRLRLSIFDVYRKQHDSLKQSKCVDDELDVVFSKWFEMMPVKIAGEAPHSLSVRSPCQCAQPPAATRIRLTPSIL